MLRIFKFFLPVLSILLMSPAYSISMYESHPFFKVLDVVSYDETNKRHIWHEKTGIVWVATDDERFIPGLWRFNPDDYSICYTIGGKQEGCFTASQKGDVVSLRNNVDGRTFDLKKSDREAPFISDLQQRLSVRITRASGSLDVPEEGRTGKEVVFWRTDGQMNALQPEGWIKTGGWWFNNKDEICDDVNGEAGCLPIIAILPDKLYLDYIISEENIMRLEVEWKYYDQ